MTDINVRAHARRTEPYRCPAHRSTAETTRIVKDARSGYAVARKMAWRPELSAYLATDGDGDYLTSDSFKLDETYETFGAAAEAGLYAEHIHIARRIKDDWARPGGTYEAADGARLAELVLALEGL